MEERFITSTKNESELEVENKLRPTSLEDYVGQEKIKNNLKVFIKAAKARDEALDHVSDLDITDIYIQKDYTNINKANAKVVDYLINLAGNNI